MAVDDLTEPVLPGPGASDYERYLRTDELLSLQPDPGKSAHRDELLFTTVHQSSELWLKLAWHEVEEATRLLAGGELDAAIRLLRRASLCAQYVTGQLDMLEQMSPWEYQVIRKKLGHGSGFDSPGFRHLRRLAPDMLPDEVISLPRIPLLPSGKVDRQLVRSQLEAAGSADAGAGD